MSTIVGSLFRVLSVGVFAVILVGVLYWLRLRRVAQGEPDAANEAVAA